MLSVANHSIWYIIVLLSYFLPHASTKFSLFYRIDCQFYFIFLIGGFFMILSLTIHAFKWEWTWRTSLLSSTVINKLTMPHLMLARSIMSSLLYTKQTWNLKQKGENRFWVYPFWKMISWRSLKKIMTRYKWSTTSRKILFDKQLEGFQLSYNKRQKKKEERRFLEENTLCAVAEPPCPFTEKIQYANM